MIAVRATRSVLYAGILQTVIPFFRAASRSILLYPVPASQISLTDSGKVIKRINPKRVTTMRRKLKKLAVKVKNEEITYENVENMFRGWMGSFYKLLSKEQRKNLIGLYEDLFEKSITIISKRMIITDKIK